MIQLETSDTYYENKIYPHIDSVQARRLVMITQAFGNLWLLAI